jgi:hypothetical protein
MRSMPYLRLENDCCCAWARAETGPRPGQRIQIAVQASAPFAVLLLQLGYAVGKTGEFRMDDRVGPERGHNPVVHPEPQISCWPASESSGESVVVSTSTRNRSSSARGSNTGVRSFWEMVSK